MKSFFSKKIVVGALVTAAVCVSSIAGAKAQESAIQGDIVSSYVWRGMYQGGDAALQPALGFEFDNSSVTAWGSADFNRGNKEPDLTLVYKFGEAGPTLTVADLWWEGEGVYKYFNSKSHKTGHRPEAGLAYTLPVKKLPLSVAWYTVSAGKDKKLNDSGELKQNYPSYLEPNYPSSVKNVDLNVTCDTVPYKAEGTYTSSGFAVTNVALKGMTEIKINDKSSLLMFAQAIWNPCVEGAFLVSGVTLRPQI